MPQEIQLSLLSLISFLGLAGMCKLSNKKQWFDLPTQRSSHYATTPRTAGIVIASLSLAYLAYLKPKSLDNPLIYFAYFSFILLGIYDDFKNLKASTKFLVQIFISASIAIFLPAFRLDDFYGIFGIHALNSYVSIGFTTFVFLVILNAYNLIDGIDGLAISFSFLGILLIGYCFYSTDSSLFQFLIGLLAIQFPLYYFNLRKNNKLFLGDTGSLFLGLTMMLLVGHFLNSQTNSIVPFNINKALYALIACCYPLLDTLRIFTLRVSRGDSPFSADKNHLHHKLLNFGLSHVSISILLILFNLFILLLNIYIFNKLSVTNALCANLIVIVSFLVVKKQISKWHATRK